MKTEKEYFIEGRLLCERGRTKEALALWNEALSHYPESTAILHHKGIILSAYGSYEEALEAFEKAAEIKPGELLYVDSAGKALNILERYDEALEYFEKAIELAFENSWVRAVGPEGQDKKTALEIRYSPAMDLFYNVAEAMQGTGELEKALEYLDWKMNLQEPVRYFDYIDMGEAQFLKGGILEELGRKKESLAAYEEGLRRLDEAARMEPKDAAIHQMKGEVLKDLGRDEEAMASFRKAKEVEPDIYIPEIDGEMKGAD